MSYRDRGRRQAYQRNWVATRKAAYFAGKRCAICGGDDGLELHHLDPSQKVSHRIWSWSAKRREAELAKCVVLCHWCHAEQRRVEYPHGTNGRYTKRGCRCAECKAAHATAAREYRNRKKQEAPHA